MNIAIIGSGIAGLSAAWLLSQKHQVTLYERHAHPGMGAFNLNYPADGENIRIDVPLRAFNTCYYRNLMALYQAMGVEMERIDHSASYACAHSGKTYFSFRYLNIGKRALPLPGGFDSWSLKTLPVLRDAGRFMLRAGKDLASGKAEGLTIDQYLRRNGYSSAFIDDVLIPSFAAICTCSYAAVRQYPASVIIGFLSSGMLFDGIWRARKGAEDAIQRMLQPCAQVYCQAEVTAIRHQDGLVHVTEQNGRSAAFDHVVIAAQANQASRLLGDDEAEAKALLGKVLYERSEVVVHSDQVLVPNRRRDRAPVSFSVDGRQVRPMASIRLNDIYPLLRRRPPVYQTWNPLQAPKAETVLGRSFFERPVVNLDSLAAIQSLQILHHQPARRIWYCGSYAMPGIPLLETAVQSAMSIANRLQVDVPWQT